MTSQESITKKDQSVVDINEINKRKILWKCDMFLIPFLWLNVTFAAMDKVSNGTASIYGMQTDLNLVGNQYSWIGSSFYFGYLFWCFPSSVILQKLPVAKVAGCCFFVWGIILIGSGFAKNFQTMVACRVLLGISEAPIVPINLIIMSIWYKRGPEQSIRLGLFYTGLSTIFTGTIGYAVGGYTDVKYSPWRYFIWIIGSLSSVYGLLEFFLLPDSPVSCRYLNEREKAIVIDRVRKNQTGVKNTKFKKEQFFQTFKDPKVWIMVAIQLFISIPNGGLTNFSPLIVNGLGWSSRDSTLLTMPTGIMQTVSVYMASGTLALLEKFFKKKHFRGAVLCFYLLPAFVGTGCLYKLPLTWYRSRLVSLYFGFFYLGSYIISLNLIAANHAGFTRKVTANAIYFLTYAVSNLIAPQFFKTSQSPTYTLGVAAIFGAYALTIVSVLLYMVVCWRENKRRDKLYGEAPEENRETDFSDMTDIDNINFRYKW
ncbi:MFS general substrate transporter [Yamadazyma tenuis ATCC 10573]|uniref:MFS general substrate transporter n=1 Tax=Candida tenuis (strain ATCC 10573 / BCRC 21748 / CBS 615 / JCM 9827 / NBRC 10315 / NRRL Y-1498 / VKM Y-70) TaxID=590646 RepID=G3BAR6_CANTC|nr:MFS general substrate transporter [Yamadazyma tenuis ATCC 10573]EGV62092.1 MFS general substrate transporter [Yamadazyma tenuis ATCC 10573]